MGHDHGHGRAAVALGSAARHRRRLAVVLVLTAAFLVVEVVAAFAANSLALLSDAGHMLTDVLGLGMALTAIELARRHGVRRRGEGHTTIHTYGLYRLEIIASFCNALLLFAVAGYVLVEAIRRISSEPEVTGTAMLVVAVAGLAVNVVAYLVLREGASESLNVEGAALEVLADMVGSAGVIVAAVLLQAFDWTWADAVFGIAIGVWILPRAWRLGGRSLRILLQAAPATIDLDEVAAELGSLDGVVDVHDLHVWTLTSGMDAASVHLVIDPSTDPHAVLDQARELLRNGHEIGHATLQVEPSDHTGCDEIGW